MAIGRIPEPGTGIPESIIAAKGDLIVGTANDTPGILSVGTNGYTLVADSAQTTGVKWAAPSSTFSGVSLYNSVNISVNNATHTILTWNSETYDTDNYHSTSSNTSRITIPTTGYYRVTAQCNLGATGDATVMRIYKNGTDIQVWYSDGDVYTGASGFITGTLYLAANDYLEVSVWQNSGVAKDIFGGTYYTDFWVERLG